jgi:hypothetical protein
MPIKKEDEDLWGNLHKEYSKEKADSIFYAMENSNKLPSQKGKKKPKKSLLTGGGTLAEVRKKQGAGFWQADIGD